MAQAKAKRMVNTLVTLCTMKECPDVEYVTLIVSNCGHRKRMWQWSILIYAIREITN
jgi:hypothetical protein